MCATQVDRVYQIESPLGANVLLLRHMAGRESLSQPFEWHLDLLSEDGKLSAEKILGQGLSISTLQPNGERRYFHGVVSEFSQGGWLQTYNEYRAVVRPWFWLLTRTADCRIFQEKTVPDIFEEVVKAYGLTDYELRLSGSYEPWEYCVQYRETDFNFLSRLLEQEGIYYFFEHEKSKHTMVLADDPGAHRTRSGYETVPVLSTRYTGPAARAGSSALMDLYEERSARQLCHHGLRLRGAAQAARRYRDDSPQA